MVQLNPKRFAGDVVDDALRGDLVERDPAEEGCLETPHDGLAGKTGGGRLVSVCPSSSWRRGGLSQRIV